MRRLIAILVVATLGSVGAAGAQSAALKIVVLEGEAAVNIIQQKTAVQPLVEVRDRNNLPVPGAAVTFAIGGGGHGAAFAGGLQTLTVTTNAAGQAAASGLNALSSGAFQIQVSAAYQGQIATAAISQTNFATAAAAAQAGASAGSGSASGAAGGAAGGGGGGISATTIGIIGAVAGGGALAATKLASSDEESGGSSSANAYTGPLAGQLVFTSLATDTQGRPTNCDRTRAVTGTLTIDLNSGGTSGKARFQVAQNELSVTGNCGPAPGESFTKDEVPVTGGPGALAFNTSIPFSGGTTIKVNFNGALAGTTITGTFAIDINAQATAPNSPTGFGSTILNVTLQK